ncbi:hypothetical protein AGMMS50262_20000 [Bacteroidia bacterium]|nr:hypothetical protein AGMMS50262_20000 [Bacteroidia bacterium]
MKKSVLKKIKKYLLISLLNVTLIAWGENPASSLRAFSLGDLRALSDELANPALLPFSEQKQIGVSVYNRFQMKELNTGTLFLKYPNPRLDLGAQVCVFGFDDFRRTQIQLGFSKKVFSDFSVGINLRYQNVFSILEEKTQHDLFSDIGLYYRLNEAICLAFNGQNLLKTQKEQPAGTCFGLSCLVSKQAIFFSEAGYENGFSFAVGLEYEILEQFLLRCGYQSRSKTPAFGIAYLWKDWTIETGFALHSVLGVSSQIGVSFNLH